MSNDQFKLIGLAVSKAHFKGLPPKLAFNGLRDLAFEKREALSHIEGIDDLRIEIE